MENKNYKSIFISDVHLGSKGCMEGLLVQVHLGPPIFETIPSSINMRFTVNKSKNQGIFTYDSMSIFV